MQFQVHLALLVETVAHAIGDKSELIDAILNQVKRGVDLTAHSVLDQDNEEDEPVHVVKKMKAEKDVQKQVDQGLDLTVPVLLGKNSTLAIKLLIANPRATKDGEEVVAAEWKSEFRQKIWNVLKENAVEHLKHSAKDPKRTAGLAFIYVALYESGDAKLQESIKKTFKNEVKALKSLIASAPVETENAAQTKRKRGSDKPSKTGIDIFLGLLQ